MNKSTIAKHLLLFFTASMTAITTAEADDYAIDCYDSCECSWFSDIELGAEFLLWKPCFDDLDYAVNFDSDVSVTPSGSGKYKYVDHNYKPGFRVGIAKKNCYSDWNLMGSYTRLSATSRNSTAPSIGGNTLSTLLQGAYLDNETNATGEHRFTYQTYDLLFGKDYTLACCHVFNPYVGVAGLLLSQDYYSELSEDTANYAEVIWGSNYWGVGFKIGSSYNWAICDSLSFYANGSAAVLTGNLSTSNLQIKADNDLNLKLRSSECLFVPGCHIALGFLYDLCFCGRTFAFNIGYEFLEWYNLGSIRRTGDTTLAYGHTSSPSKQTIGFHGLQVGGSVAF